MRKLWISVLLLAITIGGVYLYLKFNPPLEVGALASSVSNTIYCKSETSPTEKIEIYYDFKDGSVYKYTIVTTNPITKDVDREKQEQFITAGNLKYKGLIAKIWYENDTYTTTEIFDLDRLKENEMRDLTGISIKELKNTSRDELINTIVPTSSFKFTCK